MLFPQLEEKLQASKQALNTATSENIIEQCKQHLALLAEYRIQLYKLQDLQEYANSQHLLCLGKSGSESDSRSISFLWYKDAWKMRGSPSDTKHDVSLL
jgi:hypothetical protein